jgi:hypothetical protein
MRNHRGTSAVASMQMNQWIENPFLEQIVGELIKKFKCHTVLLYGSHARADRKH